MLFIKNQSPRGYFGSFCIAASVLMSGCQGDNGSTAVSSEQQPLSIENHVATMCEGESEAESNCVAFSTTLFQQVTNHQYLTGEYHKVHAGNGFASEVSQGKNVAVYVSKESAEDFLQVDPKETGSNANVAPGTIIVREVWNAEGIMDKYTAMVKMERGYFPEGGDFAYVEIDVHGNLIQGGKLEDCAACHLAHRANDGFLFGVTAEHKLALDGSPMALPMTQEKWDAADLQLKAAARQALRFDNYLNPDVFVKVTDEPYVSALNSDNYLDVYVTANGVPEFLLADPSSTEVADIDVPENTTIVRKVMSESGELKSYTIMVKGPAGYYPEGGDFYYGVFGAEDFQNGIAEQEGALTSCGDCHYASRRNQGFVFGIPTNVRGI